MTFTPRLALRVEIPQQGPFHGRRFLSLHVGPDGMKQYQLEAECEL